MLVQDFVMTMAVGVFALGFASASGGVFILIAKVIRDDLKVIARQTAEMAQKGLADDLAGLVGNASALVNALNELIKTTAGIAVSLIVLGLILIVAAYVMATQFA